jgi:hypothetical protein
MTLEEELLEDEKENLREAEFIREQLPVDLKEVFSQADLLYIIDAIVDYYYTSGVLESDDEEVDIDMQVVADYVCKQAKKDGVGTFSPDDMFFVVQADMDFQEQNL